MSYQDFLTRTLQGGAAEIALRHFGHVTPRTKLGDNNQVLTEADLEIGRYIVERIESVHPNHNIIDEEAGVIDKGSRYTWVVDPIEATSNFASGSEDYGIMIGLLEDAVPVAGGVSVPARNLLYLAEKGRGATKNGRPIRVSPEPNLASKLVSFGMDGHPEDPERTRHEAMLMAELAMKARNIRSTNCEAVDGMYVAEGIYGGRINLTSKIWDNVGPQIIVEEAGGLWIDLDGRPLDYSNPLSRSSENFAFCLAPPQLHSQLIAIVRGWQKH